MPHVEHCDVASFKGYQASKKEEDAESDDEDCMKRGMEIYERNISLITKTLHKKGLFRVVMGHVGYGLGRARACFVLVPLATVASLVMHARGTGYPPTPAYDHTHAHTHKLTHRYRHTRACTHACAHAFPRHSLPAPCARARPSPFSEPTGSCPPC